MTKERRVENKGRIKIAAKQTQKLQAIAVEETRQVDCKVSQRYRKKGVKLARKKTRNNHNTSNETDNKCSWRTTKK